MSNKHVLLLDEVSLVVQESCRHPVLTREEEQTLFVALAEGDESARQRLVECNLRLVVSIAKRYVNRGLELLDCIQEGNLGLLRAIDKFDYRLGYKFSTYATCWIRQSISREIVNKGRLTRLPQHADTKISAIRRAEERLWQELERQATDEELAEATGLRVDTVKGIRRAVEIPRSLDQELSGEDDTYTLIDSLVDDELDVAEVGENGSLRREIDAAMATLRPKEMHVLRRYFGLDGKGGCTLDTLANELDLTRERIRQIEVQGLGMMKRHSKAGHLKEWL